MRDIKIIPVIFLLLVIFIIYSVNDKLTQRFAVIKNVTNDHSITFDSVSLSQLECKALKIPTDHIPWDDEEYNTIIIPINYIYVSDRRLRPINSNKVESIRQMTITLTDKLNKSFDGYIEFERIDFITFVNFQYNILDIYNNYVYGNKSHFKYLVTDNAKVNTFNVFIIENSNVTLNDSDIMLGFTPVLENKFNFYESTSPELDNVFVSFDGLFEYDLGVTLIHETGHWFGLAHPFELSDEEKKRFGLVTKYNVCINFMNYNCFIDEFTKEQLEYAYKFAKNNRKYLIKNLDNSN